MHRFNLENLAKVTIETMLFIITFVGIPAFVYKLYKVIFDREKVEITIEQILDQKYKEYIKGSSTDNVHLCGNYLKLNK